MYSAEVVAAAMFSLLQELPRSSERPAADLDPIDEEVICFALETACQIGTFAPFRTLKPSIMASANTLFSTCLASLFLVSDAGLSYGPLPSGLSGHELALSALALEVLEMRSPQRLLAAQPRKQN